MSHLNSATKVALSESNNTLDKKLYAYLCKMLEADENGKLISDEMREINEDVVYFVLNGTDIRNNKRALAAGMNWAKLDERVVEGTLLKETNLAGVLPQDEMRNRTLLYSTKKEDLSTKIDEARYINLCWSLISEEYLQLTTEQEAKNNLLTLNHWLLNKTNTPLNIGVYWGHDPMNVDTDGGYFHLEKETFKNIGVSNIHKDEFNPLWLPKNFAGNFKYDRSLNEIKNHMSEMTQDNDVFNTFKNIGFAIYHIIRSYGCWGGKSFYSIPINYGSENEKRIGVLSICSKKPLSEKLIERWSLVANKVFKDTILHEIDLFKEYERKNRLISATYGIGHLFGNSIEDAETPFNVLKAFVDNDKTPNDTVNNIREKMGEVQVGFSKLKDISKILHILAKALKEKDSNIFEREGWHSTENLNVFEIIKNLENREVDSKTCLIEFDSINAIRLNPFLCDGKLLPAKFIYENLFLELFINCIKHHSDKEKVKKLIVRFERGILVFRNISKPDTPLDCSEIDENNSGGAILYIAYLLRETKIGNIFRRRIVENGLHFFEAGIELKGMIIEKT